MAAAGRRLPFADVLLLMIALSDNLCTNLVIRRIGIARLNRVFREELGLLNGTRLERKLMDYAAREPRAGQLGLGPRRRPTLHARAAA